MGHADGRAAGGLLCGRPSGCGLRQFQSLQSGPVCQQRPRRHPLLDGTVHTGKLWYWEAMVLGSSGTGSTEKQCGAACGHQFRFRHPSPVGPAPPPQHPQMSKQHDRLVAKHVVGRARSAGGDSSSGLHSPSQSESLPPGPSMASTFPSVSGPSAPAQLTCHVWGVDGRVFAANTAGEVLALEPTDGTVVRSAEPAGGVVVTCMLVTRDRLVVGCEDGCVRWLSLTDFSVQRLVTVAPRVKWAEGAPVLPIYSIAAAPSFRKLFACTTEGTVHTMVLDTEEDPSSRRSKDAEFDFERVRAGLAWLAGPSVGQTWGGTRGWDAGGGGWGWVGGGGGSHPRSSLPVVVCRRFSEGVRRAHDPRITRIVVLPSRWRWHGLLGFASLPAVACTVLNRAPVPVLAGRPRVRRPPVCRAWTGCAASHHAVHDPFRHCGSRWCYACVGLRPEATGVPPLLCTAGVPAVCSVPRRCHRQCADQPFGRGRKRWRQWRPCREAIQPAGRRDAHHVNRSPWAPAVGRAGVRGRLCSACVGVP